MLDQTLQLLPLTAEGDFAPILALDGETLGGDAVLGQVALNFAEARLLAAPVLPNLLVARSVRPSGNRGDWVWAHVPWCFGAGYLAGRIAPLGLTMNRRSDALFVRIIPPTQDDITV